MIEILGSCDESVCVDLERHEAHGLVAVLEAVMLLAQTDGALLKTLGVTQEALRLADLAGAKVIQRM